MMNLFLSIDIPTICQTLYDKFHYKKVQEFQIFPQISQYLQALSPCIKKPSQIVNLMMI